MTNIHSAILAVMAQVGYVQKEKSDGLRYSFASERALIEALRPAMVGAGITVHLESIDEMRESEVLSDKGKVIQHVRLIASYVFTHGDSNTSRKVQVAGGAMDYGDKAISKALTMALKPALRQTFLMETGDEDPDAEELDASGSQGTRAVAGGGQEVKQGGGQKPPKPRQPIAEKPAAASDEQPGAKGGNPPAVEVQVVARPEWAAGQPDWLPDATKRTNPQKGFSGPDMENAVKWGAELQAFPAPGETEASQTAHGQAVRLIMLKSPLLPGFNREQFEAFTKPYRMLRDSGQSSANAAAGACETFEENLQEIVAREGAA